MWYIIKANEQREHLASGCHPSLSCCLLLSKAVVLKFAIESAVMLTYNHNCWF